MPSDGQVGEPAFYGPFRIERLLARGGMAMVFLAREKGLEGFERRVVIKRVLPHLADDPAFVEMFLAEARLAARLVHPAIVQVHEFGRCEGDYFISMEYVEGASLSQIQRRLGRPLPVEHAVRIAATLCEGLEYAHTLRGEDGAPLGVVHRDVSPQNVLVSVHGTVKLADFGIAKALEKGTTGKSGTLKGKLPYASPERLLGASADPRSDVFAAGVVLFEMLTGQVLFDGNEPGVIVHRIVNEPIPRVSERGVSCPADLEAIVARALAKRPDERHASAGELQVDLERSMMRAGLLSNAPLLARFLGEAGVFEVRTPAKADPASPGVAAPRAVRSEDPPSPTRTERAAELVTRTAVTSAPEAAVVRAAPEEAVVRAAPVAEPQTTPRRRAGAVLGSLVVLGVASFFVVGSLGGAGEPDAPAIATTATPLAAAATGAPETTAPVPVSTPPASAAPTPEEPGTTAPQSAAPEAASTSESRRPASRESGLLSLDTTPWSNVFWRGRLLGPTPLAEVELPAGPQSLTLVDATGRRHRARITIEPNAHVRRRLEIGDIGRRENGDTPPISN